MNSNIINNGNASNILIGLYFDINFLYLFSKSFYRITKSISIEIHANPTSVMLKSIVRDMFIFFTFFTY